jgi:RNA polymerase sigma-70 factor, ECF subfamily
MDSSGAPRDIPSFALPQLHGRLLRWRREQFIAAGYDELSAQRMAVDRTAVVHTVVVPNDDVVIKMGASSRGRAGRQVSEVNEPTGLMVRRREQYPPRADDVLPAADDWVSRLSMPGRAYEDAVAQLHKLMLRAARHQISRMPEAAALGASRCAEIIHSAADEATVSVLSRLSTFEGRSAFTTWAYKFGILHAGTQVRRAAWRDREINLDDISEPHQTVAPSPEVYAEGRDLARAVRNGLREALTPHQRRVAVAVLVDEVPIDVLAERLRISRGALYKTLHDARQRLRAYLSAHDFLLPVATRKEVTR